MSKTIDQRVVEMRFDNKQFESNVATSIGTLDKLKQSLDLSGATRGLDSLSSPNRDFGMGGLGNAVETVNMRFSALEVVAVTALANITNSALNTGRELLRSLTTAPVKDGFDEYEMTLNSIQTIMAGTGKTADEVGEQLKRLDKYADDTIYSSSDMFNNLPKFTNAGVELDKAVTAMIGISNATAIAGGNADQASIAFYNLGQSIGTGYLNRIDYNSIDSAGIATMEWKNQMVSAAIAQGKLTKVGDDAYEAGGKLFSLQSLFIDGLQEQWASADVLMNVFGDYGDVTTDIGKKAQASAQDIKDFTGMMASLKATAGTGWKDTWELIFGGLEDAKELWTGLGSAIGDFLSKTSEARNSVLKSWNDLGGRATMIESFKNAFVGLQSVLKPIGEAFREIFEPMTGKRLADITTQIQELTAKFKIGDETADKLKRTFAGLFAGVDLVAKGFRFLAEKAASLVGAVLPIGEGFLGITALIGDFVVALNDGAKAGDFLNTAFEKVGEILSKVSESVRNLIDDTVTAFAGFSGIDMGPLDEFLEKIKDRLKPLSKISVVIGSAFEGIKKIMSRMTPIFIRLGEILGTVFGKMADSVESSLNNLDFDRLLDLLDGGLFAALLLSVRNFFTGLTRALHGDTGFFGKIKDLLDGVRGSLESWQQNLNAKTLLTIAGAVALLAGSLFLLATIDSKQLTMALGAITTLFVELTATLMVLSKATLGKGLTKAAATMVLISASLLILAAAMKMLSNLDWGEILKGAVAVGTLSAILVTSAEILSKSSGKLIRGSMGLVIFAGAILILAQAVKQLGGLDAVSLTKGLIGVGVVVAELALFMKAANLDQTGLSKGVGLMAMALAVRILASAVQQFSAIPLGGLIQGLAAMGIVLTELSLFMKFTGNPAQLFSTSAGLIALGIALSIFAGAIKKLGGMNLADLTKGLLGMAAALGIMAVTSKLLAGNASGAASILLLSIALGVLAVSLRLLGSMDLVTLGKAVLGLVAVFAVLGGATVLLAPLTPAILALAGAIALLGVGILAIGGGVMLFSAGLTALAVSGTAVAAALVAIVSSLASLIPFVAQKLGEGLVAFAQVIGENMPAMVDAILTFVLGMVQVLTEATPQIVDAIVNFITVMLQKLTEAIPQLIDAGTKLLVGLLEGLAKATPQIAKAGADVVIAFLTAIGTETPRIVDAAFKMMIDFINGLADSIRENMPMLMDAINNLATAIIEGLVDGLFGGIGTVSDMIKTLVDKMLEDFCSLLGIHSPSTVFKDFGGNIIDGLINGLKNGFDLISGSVKELGDNIINGMSDLPNRIREVADGVIDGLAQGLSNGVNAVKNAARDVAAKALSAAKNFLDSHSPSRKFIKLGEYSSEGLAIGLTNMAGMVKRSSEKVGATALETMKKSIKGIGDGLDSDMDYAPVITPVVDMSQVDRGLANTFDKKHNLNVSEIKGRAVSVQTVGKTEGSDNEGVINNSSTDNRKIEVVNHYHVRSDDDIRKISKDLSGVLNRFNNAKGVPVS